MPQQVLADGAVDFAIAWVPKALATREAGADIVNIAQIFQRSGTLQVSFADAGITTPADFAGKNDRQLGLRQRVRGVRRPRRGRARPGDRRDLVAQDFNMNGLLSGDIDAAEAMTYNEYAQVLEAVNAETGELYTPEDFNVISYEDVGVGMLQDAIWADAKLGRPGLQGHRRARRRRLDAGVGLLPRQRPRRVSTSSSPPVPARRQPPAVADERGQQAHLAGGGGIGMMDEAAWDRTVEIALDTPNLEGATVLTAPPTDGAYTNEIVEPAITISTKASTRPATDSSRSR